MEYQVVFYSDRNGRCPTEDYLDTLQDKPRAKCKKWMEKIEQHGPNLPRPFADIVQGKIRELRVLFSGDHHRFLYFFDLKRAVITHGFMKKTNEVPAGEIERAIRIMNTYFNEFGKGG